MFRLSVTKTWSTDRETPRTIDTQSWLWRRMRQDVLVRDKFSCRFCGVKSLKYMICDHIDGNPSNNKFANLGINCPMCDAVRHCGLAGIKGVLALGVSSMGQDEICRRTLELFCKSPGVPSFEEVDESAVLVAESTVGYANVLLRLDDGFDYTTECDRCPASTPPHTYDMHKGFFKPNAAILMEHIFENRIQ